MPSPDRGVLSRTPLDFTGVAHYVLAMAKHEDLGCATLGESGQDYLKGIDRLTREGKPGHERAGMQELADHLGVSAASTSRMLKHLGDLGYVEHEPYRGASLTPEGERAALEVLRHHRLLEAFLREKLDYRLDEVHAEAERLEHHISGAFAARIDEALGSPTVDPHGDPIPAADCTTFRADDVPPLALAGVPEGGRFTIGRVPSADAEQVRYLDRLGLVPGAEGEMVEQIPFGGGVRLRMPRDGGERVIGQDLARSIGVMVQPPAGR